ncbi:hypothetical protein [Schlesneria sp. DSM 10557]|uniref:hypothetical protein n=1 Tax=Schlesneria sp. DSM 10557 TaxID=3044399 RepID=UPI0035A115CC
MAISRFNYTGLQKINRRDVQITLNIPKDSPPEFAAELSLTGYEFPADSLVFVEAYRQTTWMRFSFGSVKGIVRPVDTKLTEFDSPDEIRFRVRVTASGENSGKMLGEADQIRPVGEMDDDDERSPLLNVRPADIGDEVYRVEMEQTPVLLINRNVGDWRAAATSPIFQALTAPAILRSVLTHLLVIDDASDPDDDESPHARWLRFAISLPGVAECPEDKDARPGWIDDVVSSFARQKQVLTSFMNAWQKG